MKETPTLDSLAGRLARFMQYGYEADLGALALIKNACTLCKGREDMRHAAAAIIEIYLSWGMDYDSWVYCGECGVEFQPAPLKALSCAARRYVDFVMDVCKESSDPFHCCKACGGQLPFDF